MILADEYRLMQFHNDSQHLADHSKSFKDMDTLFSVFFRCSFLPEMETHSHGSEARSRCKTSVCCRTRLSQLCGLQDQVRVGGHTKTFNLQLWQNAFKNTGNNIQPVDNFKVGNDYISVSKIFYIPYRLICLIFYLTKKLSIVLKCPKITSLN